jgi:glutamate-1-semialdehyde 2,1-aminomutase
MALLDPTKGPPRVLSGGTFSANPLTMAAGLAAMELYTRAEVERLNALGGRLRDGMNALLEKYEEFGGVEDVFFTSFIVQ